MKSSTCPVSRNAACSTTIARDQHSNKEVANTPEPSDPESEGWKGMMSAARLRAAAFSATRRWQGRNRWEAYGNPAASNPGRSLTAEPPPRRACTSPGGRGVRGCPAGPGAKPARRRRRGRRPAPRAPRAGVACRGDAVRMEIAIVSRAPPCRARLAVAHAVVTGNARALRHGLRSPGGRIGSGLDRFVRDGSGLGHAMTDVEGSDGMRL